MEKAIEWWNGLDEEQQREYMLYYFPDRRFEKIKKSVICIQRIFIQVKPK